MKTIVEFRVDKEAAEAFMEMLPKYGLSLYGGVVHGIDTKPRGPVITANEVVKREEPPPPKKWTAIEVVGESVSLAKAIVEMLSSGTQISGNICFGERTEVVTRETPEGVIEKKISSERGVIVSLNHKS